MTEERYSGGGGAVPAAQKVFDKEIEALILVRNAFAQTEFRKVYEEIVGRILACKGKVIFTGMGKSGHVARKIAATMSSLGTCSMFLHPAECMHGDLGMVQAQDVVVAVSHSGESDEIARILPGIRKIGAAVIGITSEGSSALARNSHIAQVFPAFSEACLLGLAPTSSTTAAMVYGDALAVTLAGYKKVDRKDFARLHPAGELGRRLTVRTADCMRRISESECLMEGATVQEALALICRTQCSLLPVSDKHGDTAGVLYSYRIAEAVEAGTVDGPVAWMVDYTPPFIHPESMAVEALELMRENGVAAVMVVNDGKAVGILDKESIRKAGITTDG